MTARDTIAEVMRETYWDSQTHDWSQMAAAVITAIRAMPPKRQAELIGGITQTNAAGTVTRVVGLWQETPQ